MSRKKTIGAMLMFAGMIIAVITLVVSASLGEEGPTGYRFTMTMANPSQDDVVFSGAVLGKDLSLEHKIGAIKTIDLLSGGKLYILTPAIKTAREVENPDPPKKDAAGWPQWLVAPGHINPLTFAGVIGQQANANGEVPFGAFDQITAKFEAGRLVQLKFPSPTGKGTTVYNYTDFKEDKQLSSVDFAVPADYQKSK